MFCMKGAIFKCGSLFFAFGVFAQSPSSLKHSEDDWRELAVAVCDAANERTHRWEIVLPRPSVRWRRALPFYKQLMLDVVWLSVRLERAGLSERTEPSTPSAQQAVKSFDWKTDTSLEESERALLRQLKNIAAHKDAMNRMVAYFNRLNLQGEAYHVLCRILEAYKRESEALSHILETEYVPGTKL